MSLINIFKRIFGKTDTMSHDTFDVDYIVWVGDPMDSTHPVDKRMEIPKYIIDGMGYKDAEDTVYEYIRDRVNFGAGLQLDNFWKNEYVCSIYNIPDLSDNCPISKGFEDELNKISRG